MKVFQDPLFGHPIPKRLFQVIGEENREFFLQARRAIGRGLGPAHATCDEVTDEARRSLARLSGVE